MTYTSIEWDRAALIVVDVQNDFVDGTTPVPGTANVLPVLTELLDVFRAARRPIAHVIRLYVPGGSDVDPVRRAHIESGLQIVSPGSRGAAIPAQLTGGNLVELDVSTLLSGSPQQLTPDEAIFYKPRWSAFYRTGLLDWLTTRAVTSVIVAGCNLPNCPRATLFDASERDFRAAVIADATSQTTAQRLDDLRVCCTDR
ncbi:cysteine hydrolase [Microbacterium bovistercoris]|uniref:Cysteine hydrolase n=1 Tax=Microbacterium bovistercoris TaxID=2293570 RepID=A0A371NUY9_9MICO|nr:isochorismatase family cysteine hydrolase [Microbacterium bovistercoris]REJ06238.1 cysteine hydrolase [Microbacterium bovistercoris]